MDFEGFTVGDWIEKLKAFDPKLPLFMEASSGDVDYMVVLNAELLTDMPYEPYEDTEDQPYIDAVVLSYRG